MKRVVVTGGAGFVGAHFVPLLLDAYPDVEVRVVDILRPTANPELISGWPRAELLRIDIRDGEALHAALDGCCAVVNLAAETFVDLSIDAPALFADVNVLGVVTLLNAARKAGVARFLHVSTDEVWGEVLGGVVDEATAYRPRNPYSASKAAGDHFVAAYGATYGISASIVHFTNLYGPYQYPEKLIPKGITRLRAGLSIELYGEGQQIRSWLHVEDAARGLLAALRVGSPGDAYIVGSCEETTNLDIAECLCRLAGRDPAVSISFVADRPGHDFRYAVSIERARRDLDWAPRYELESGLRDTFAWYTRNDTWLKSRAHAARLRRGLVSADGTSERLRSLGGEDDEAS